MQVTIKLHALSSKILQYQYGDADGVIHVTRHSEINNIFLMRWKDWASSNQTIHQEYDQLVTFSLSKKLGGIVDRNAIKVAQELYNRHRSVLFHFILGHVIDHKNPNAKAAIRLFYHIYNISEDDIDSDSVYKAWGRWHKQWKQNKTLSGQKPTTRRVGRVTKIITATPQGIADHQMGSFIQLNIDKYTSVTGSIIISLIHQLQAYVYFNKCLLTFTELADIQDLSVSGVKKRVYAFRDNVNHDDELRQSFIDIFGPIES